MTDTPIRCSVPGCRVLSAVITNGHLELKARHHGEKHTITIPMDWLVQQHLHASG